MAQFYYEIESFPGMAFSPGVSETRTQILSLDMCLIECYQTVGCEFVAFSSLSAECHLGSVPPLKSGTASSPDGSSAVVMIRKGKNCQSAIDEKESRDMSVTVADVAAVLGSHGLPEASGLTIRQLLPTIFNDEDACKGSCLTHPLCQTAVVSRPANKPLECHVSTFTNGDGEDDLELLPAAYGVHAVDGKAYISISMKTNQIFCDIFQ